jgi:hypothetical protein
MSEESEIDKKMTEFYQRKLRELPIVSEAKPFEVKVIEQKTESIPFKNVDERRLIEDEQAGALAPPPPGITSVDPNKVSSGGGTTITIRGDNFVSGVTVKIAGNDATNVTFVNSTTITCVTPADGIGFVNVEVTNPGGQKVNNPNLLQYTNIPDNVLVEGFQTQRSEANDGKFGYPTWFYPYKITLRLGPNTFNPPAGVSIIVTLVNGRPTFSYYYPNLSYQNLLSTRFGTGPSTLDSPGYSGFLTFNNTTGATQTLWLGCTANNPFDAGGSPPVFIGGSGFADVAAVMWIGTQGAYPALSPTYGDGSNQPRAFRIFFNGNGPYPPNAPPTPANDRFAWEDLGPRPGTWGWGPSETKQIKVSRVNSGGTLVTTYTGTPTITINLLPATSQYTGVNPISSSAFSGGSRTILVTAYNTYHDVSNSQGYGYFSLSAQDGVVSGSTPLCGVLNHY